MRPDRYGLPLAPAGGTDAPNISALSAHMTQDPQQIEGAGSQLDNTPSRADASDALARSLVFGPASLEPGGRLAHSIAHGLAKNRTLLLHKQYHYPIKQYVVPIFVDMTRSGGIFRLAEERLAWSRHGYSFGACGMYASNVTSMLLSQEVTVLKQIY